MTQATRTRTGQPAAATEKGRVARQTAGAETVEIKATIAAKNIRSGLKHLGLDTGNAERRFVYFFDTPRLTLFQSGVIVRARRVPGQDHDSTVKIRPVRAESVPAKWHKDKGFKLEADCGEKAIVRSASLSRPVAKGLIKRVEAAEQKLATLFDKSQELFLAEMCRVRYDLSKLVTLGPIAALWWKIAHPGLPAPMTAELWTREDGETVLEASIRVPVAQAAFANAGFLAFLSELGAERDNAQQAKTRWALEYYAGRASPAGRGKEKAKPPKGKKERRKPVEAKTKAKPAIKSKPAVKGRPSARAKPPAAPPPGPSFAPERPAEPAKQTTSVVPSP